MSTHHEETVTLKPIGEVARFQRNLIPANIPGTYALKPALENVAGEENIRSGIIAFRDFLYVFCDRLVSDGPVYAKPPQKPGGMADYPFLHNITNMLVEIGYHGKLAERGDSLLVTEMPSCAPSIDGKGKKKAPKISYSSQMECLRFLALCGFAFTGIDLDAKALILSETQLLEVSYPENPLLPAGLKALSVADMELRPTRRYWNDNHLLQCDYRLIKADDTDMLDVLKDFLHPLPKKVQEFALQLHRRYVDMGMTCSKSLLGEVSFSYAYIRKNRKALPPRELYAQRVWEFSYSLRNGYCLFVRAKKTEAYADVIETFPVVLQEKIAKGYGCDRKLRNERCQHGCQGIRIPLDDAILAIGRDMERWLDNETPSSWRR